MNRALLHAAAIAVTLGTPSPGHGTASTASCHGRGIAAMEQALGSPVDRSLDQVLAAPLISLWKQGHPASRLVPDHVHVLLRPADPLVVALTADTCVVDAIPMSRKQLAEFLRRLVGPAI